MTHTLNAYGFHRGYSDVLRKFWSDGNTPGERQIAAELGVSPNTLLRMRRTYDTPRGSTGLTESELDALRELGASVAHPWRISTSHSA